MAQRIDIVIHSTRGKVTYLRFDNTKQFFRGIPIVPLIGNASRIQQTRVGTQTPKSCACRRWNNSRQ